MIPASVRDEMRSRQLQRLKEKSSGWTRHVMQRVLHDKQRAFVESPAPRKVIRAGRRGGKTTGIAYLAVAALLAGRRVLYATPTAEQIGTFWAEVKASLYKPVHDGILKINETEHTIERAGYHRERQRARIRAKTAWNADTLRGDYADLLIFDEWQLMNEDAWSTVGAPMLLDNGGDAVFIYTPPSLRSRSSTKANDPRHASKLYKAAEKDTSGRWATFHFTSLDNPHLDRAALEEITKDMSRRSYEKEILADDSEDVEGALWSQDILDSHRREELGEIGLARVVVAVDPATTAVIGQSDETGIVVAAKGTDGRYYVLDDRSLTASPAGWASQAIVAYRRWKADKIIAERNNGGDMVESTLSTVDSTVPVKLVWASRGKVTRAEPVTALYENGKVSHVGRLDLVEDEMTTWIPGMASPSRMDALVWALTELALGDDNTLKTSDKHPLLERW